METFGRPLYHWQEGGEVGGDAVVSSACVQDVRHHPPDSDHQGDQRSCPDEPSESMRDELSQLNQRVFYHRRRRVTLTFLPPLIGLALNMSLPSRARLEA